MQIRCGNTIIFMNEVYGAGDETGSHVHTSDGHTTVCTAGAIRIERWPDGLDGPKEHIDIGARGCAFIKKDMYHNVIGLVDDSAYMCVWSLVVDKEGVEIPGQTKEMSLVELDACAASGINSWQK